jgi:hypothetical protein
VSRQRIPVCTALLVLIAACAAAGCRPQLQPDPDAVLYYFRNARVQGEVKRVWPEGQQYVDAVLKADGKLQKELGKLGPWQSPESLWPRDDPQWRDPNAVKKQIGELTKLVRDVAQERKKVRADAQAAIATNDAKKISDAIDELIKRVVSDEVDKRMDVPQEGVEARETAFSGLKAAIEAVPESLKLAPADAAAFVTQVWQALGLDAGGAPMQSTEVAKAHLDLLKTVRDSAVDLDPNASGLKFKDASRQEPIDKAYGELAARLLRNREQFLQVAEQELVARRQPTKDPREERYQGFRRAYLRKQLEAIPKSIAALIERTEGQLKQAEKSKAKSAPAEVAFLKQRIKDLSVLREELKARTEAILKKAQTAK